MDITQAILLSIFGNFVTDAIRNSYMALKKALTAKYGQNSDLCDAINKLEKAPDRKDRQETLKVEVKLAKANNDPELLQLAHKLLNKLNYQPSEQVNNMNVINSKNTNVSVNSDATGYFNTRF